MKSLIATISLLALLLVGCQKPTEVQLVDDATFDAEQVVEPDPTVSRSSVDSTGLLPKDQAKFAGLFMVTSVKTDDGFGIVSSTSAYTVLENRSLVFLDSLRRKRFKGVFLGQVSVNLFPLASIPRIVGGDSAGFEYFRFLPFTARTRYVFAGGGPGSDVDRFAVSVDAPDNLIVHAPAGGTQVTRGKDLHLQWTGQGEIFGLVMSALRLEGNQIRRIPILAFRQKKNLGHGKLSKTILDSLPRGAYLLTFAISNRDEIQTVSRFQGKVLVQAASIYNVRIDLK